MTGLTYTRKGASMNGRSRIDLDPDNSWANKRFWGYIGSIEESASENKGTPYQVTVVGRVWTYGPIFDPSQYFPSLSFPVGWGRLSGVLTLFLVLVI